MENEKLNRQSCLLDSRNLIIAINLFLKELDEDFFRYGLEPCQKCRRMLASDGCADVHARLREIFDAVLQIRDNILEIRSQLNPQRR